MTDERRRTHVPRLPGPLTFLLVLIAALLLPLALVSSWTAAVVTDTDEYVETVTPLAEDPHVLAGVRRELEIAAVRAMARTPAAGQQTTQVNRVIKQVTSDRRFRTVWASANRTVHQQAIAVLENDNSNVDTSGSYVTIDLEPLVTYLERDLDRSGIPTPRVAGATFINVMKTSDLEKFRSGYVAIDRLGYWLPIAWVVLVIVLLLTARRRLATLGRLAVGSIITLLLLAAVLSVARDRVVERSPDEDLLGAVWDTLASSLWTSLWTLVIVAAATLLVRIVVGVVLRTRNRGHALPR
ncbi:MULTISPECIES: hypothetical protein [unclassified Nocardioides]|uniref:hypothetical protein n=1 Tax=unclassified Nocardioides TaxID=2615069 RepID=UPI0006F75793|nr:MULTISPECIES: hypothetical protein [unclassified Nocardioides]KQY57092.1 hypothetical protein ASD30_12600 [Nocardioides sp. Root140]KQZ68601.1 hypothetical protein ASD66_15010 [Nocardioides sp. Root151]KRF11732.1 hypothetical protein ASH02_17245 [Nocardioides sp. Soil796]